MYFEAGALSKHLAGKVCPFLLDLMPNELQGNPLSHFQAICATEEGTRKLLETINGMQPDAISERELTSNFERLWPEFREKIQATKILEGGGGSQVFVIQHTRERLVYSERINVLIVEDESGQRGSLASTVNSWRMNSETATDGYDALEKLEQSCPKQLFANLVLDRL